MLSTARRCPYGVYGQFSDWKPRDMTFSEPSWRDTPPCHEIRHEELATYFTARVVRGPEMA